MNETPIVGIPIVRQRHLDRGTTYMVGGRLMVGTGLLRGVAYTVPGTVERGYVLDHVALAVRLVDAITGRVVPVRPDDCIEVDPNQRGDWTRSEALIHGI